MATIIPRVRACYKAFGRVEVCCEKPKMASSTSSSVIGLRVPIKHARPKSRQWRAVPKSMSSCILRDLALITEWWNRREVVQFGLGIMQTMNDLDLYQLMSAVNWTGPYCSQTPIPCFVGEQAPSSSSQATLNLPLGAVTQLSKKVTFWSNKCSLGEQKRLLETTKSQYFVFFVKYNLALFLNRRGCNVSFRWRPLKHLVTVSEMEMKWFQALTRVWGF